MINPEKYSEYKALGYTQEYHRIPMYRILYCILYLREQQKLATVSRIAKEINQSQQYVSVLLNVYWKWQYVMKKLVRTTNKKYRKVDNCTFHWDVSMLGKRKLNKLREQFGEMIITSSQDNI